MTSAKKNCCVLKMENQSRRWKIFKISTTRSELRERKMTNFEKIPIFSCFQFNSLFLFAPQEIYFRVYYSQDAVRHTLVNMINFHSRAVGNGGRKSLGKCRPLEKFFFVQNTFSCELYFWSLEVGKKLFARITRASTPTSFARSILINASLDNFHSRYSFLWIQLHLRKQVASSGGSWKWLTRLVYWNIPPLFFPRQQWVKETPIKT